VFQNGGGRTTPYLISEIRSTRGDVIWAHAQSAPTPVLDVLYATRMVGLLKGVIQFGTGAPANIGRPAAGKTGTSQNWRDAWFVGFTPDVLTAVWVGNDDGAPMAHVTGGQLPAEIWKKFMTLAEKNLPARDFPWLVNEPEPPAAITVTDETPEDQPPDMQDDATPDSDSMASADADAPDAVDTGDDSAQGPPAYYDPSGRGPSPYGRGDDGAPAPPIPAPNPNLRQPQPQGYAEDSPEDASQQKTQGGPQMPADADPRYRY
jgi:membrane peptidoglycan carboxypeptidase